MIQVICLEDVAFYTLVEKVVDRIGEKNNIKRDQWISPEEAMTKFVLLAQRYCKNYVIMERYGLPNLKKTHPL